jgi:hypothetical protein
MRLASVPGLRAMRSRSCWAAISYFSKLKFACARKCSSLGGPLLLGHRLIADDVFAESRRASAQGRGFQPEDVGSDVGRHVLHVRHDHGLFTVGQHENFDSFMRHLAAGCHRCAGTRNRNGPGGIAANIAKLPDLLKRQG